MSGVLLQVEISSCLPCVHKFKRERGVCVGRREWHTFGHEVLAGIMKGFLFG